MYTRKFIIGAFFLIGILVQLRKRIKMNCRESYPNILDSFLLACPLYLLVAKYLTAKAKR